MSEVRRPKPFLFPEFCKSCGRCITVCNRHSIGFGDRINPKTGLVPVEIDLETCNGCGLCFEACPEPYGLLPRSADAAHFELETPTYWSAPALERLLERFPDRRSADLQVRFDGRPEGLHYVQSESALGPRATSALEPVDRPDQRESLPACEPLVVKGNYAAAIGALLAGCRHVFGYPITPSTEGAELMAALLPKLQGVFLQAVSEVATVNHIFGTGSAGLRSMTFTSSPGFSLMLEGISYMIGGEVPGVFVNIMRGGPGLGNIAPEQSDIKLACRGLGHGNTHAIVFAPSTPQEMLDMTMRAFDLSFTYRNPVIILGDGDLGQMTGRVVLPATRVRPGLPAWAVWGDEAHRRNLISSILLDEHDLEQHNLHLNRKYERMRAEAMAELFQCDEAEVVLVACNTPARMAKGAVWQLRSDGVKAGLFRPQTLWPFPIDAFLPLLRHARRIVFVEASAGQLEDELRLALSHAGVHDVPEIDSVRHFGGILPQQDEIVAKVRSWDEVHA